jgi:hypothetical protein
MGIVLRLYRDRNCYSKRQKAEDRGQKVDYWYVVVLSVKSVLTYVAMANIDEVYGLLDQPKILLP